MATVSISHMIIFIASLVVAGSVAGVFIQEVDRMSAAIDDQGLDVSNKIRTDVEVISDAGSQVYDVDGNQNITILVKNTGSQQLAADSDQIDLLVNGTYVTDFTVTVVDGSEWDVGNVVELDINQSLGTGDQRVKVIVNGDEEVFEFRT